MHGIKIPQQDFGLKMQGGGGGGGGVMRERGAYWRDLCTRGGGGGILILSETH